MTESLDSDRIPRKARALLSRMLAQRQITRDGMDWLIAATDPFHDSEIRLQGYPDILSTKSVVQCVTLTENIATNQPSTDNWDCHIFLNPCAQPWNRFLPGGSPDPAFYRTFVTSFGAVVGTQDPAPELYAGLNCIGTEAGADWFTQGLPVAGALAPGLAIQAGFSYGSYRLIACGFEVTNTTAEIYKQGSVTCYKSPSSIAYSVLSGPTAVFKHTELAPLPPTTVPNAALFPNSRTWAASDGIYQVCTLNEEQNNFRQPQGGAIAGLMSNTSLTQLQTGANYIMYLPRVAGPAGTNSNSPQNFRFPFDVSGCIFSGLSPQTTLQVTVKYYFERIPTFTDPSLVVLASPTAQYDPVALEIYSRVMSELPVGVPVGENPLGEWFSDVLAAVEEWAPRIGSALSFLPGASLVGQGLGIGAKALKTVIPRPLPPPLPARKAEVTVVETRDPRRRRYKAPLVVETIKERVPVRTVRISNAELMRRAQQRAIDKANNR